MDAKAFGAHFPPCTSSQNTPIEYLSGYVLGLPLPDTLHDLTLIDESEEVSAWHIFREQIDGRVRLPEGVEVHTVLAVNHALGLDLTADLQGTLAAQASLCVRV